MRRMVQPTRDATVDVIDIVYYLADHDTLTVSNRFTAAIKKGYKQIADAPGIGAPRDYGNPALVGMRMFPVPGFPKYLIFYRVVGDTVEILHVKHGAQNLDALFAQEEE